MTAWDHMHPKQSVKIQYDKALSNQELKSLVKLYLPIIGHESCSLYLYLKMTEKEDHFRVSKLLNDLNLNLERLYQARSQLEGIGLLSIFQSQENRDYFIYKLEDPLKHHEFFSDPLMTGLLVQKLGSQSVQQLISEEKAYQAPANFKNQTQNFYDIFDFDMTDHQTKCLQPESEVSKPVINKEVIDRASKSFNFVFLKEGLKNHFVNQDSIDEEILNIAATYHLIYGFDEVTMQKILMNAADIQTGNITAKSFTSEILSYIERKDLKPQAHEADNYQSLDEYAQKLIVEAKKLQLPDQQIDLIVAAIEMLPAEFIQSIKKQRNGYVSSNEQWALRELVGKSSLDNSVINILVHYILEVLGNPTLNQNLANTIANDWGRAGIDDPLKAMQYVNAHHQKKLQRSKLSNYQRYSRKRGRQEAIPDWMKAQENKKSQESRQHQNHQGKHDELDDLISRFESGTEGTKR